MLKVVLTDAISFGLRHDVLVPLNLWLSFISAASELN